MATTRGVLKRAETRLRRYAFAVALLVGVLLTVGGSFLGATTWYGASLLGVGAGLVGSAIYSAVMTFRDDVVDVMLNIGLDEAFLDRNQRFRDSDWVDLIASAHNYYRILGVANHGYLGTAARKREFERAFKDAIGKNKIEVELLWLAPDDKQAELRDRQEPRDTIADTIESILWFWELYEGLSSDDKQKLILREYRDIPTCGITWADNQIIVTHYLAGELNLESPGLILALPSPHVSRFIPWRPTETLASKYRDHYSEIAVNAQFVGPDRIQEFREMLQRRRRGPSEADFRDESNDGPRGGAQ